jgi:hypothetical protein
MTSWIDFPMVSWAFGMHPLYPHDKYPPKFLVPQIEDDDHALKY